MTRTIVASGVTFSPSAHGDYWACDDCGGLVKPDSDLGVAPEDHRCDEGMIAPRMGS